MGGSFQWQGPFKQNFIHFTKFLVYALESYAYKKQLLEILPTDKSIKVGGTDKSIYRLFDRTDKSINYLDRTDKSIYHLLCVFYHCYHCTKRDSQISQGSTRMAPRGQILQKKKNIRYIQPINMIKLTVSSSYWQQVNSFSAGETKHQGSGLLHQGQSTQV